MLYLEYYRASNSAMMNEEKQHVENLLRKLCRICGNRIKFNRGYINASQ